MKKIIIIMFMIFGLLLPTNASAAPNPNDYNTKNLVEVINEENETFRDAEGYTEINLSIQNVNDTDDQVPVYVFFGLGCDYCKQLLEFLNQIAPEYDAKFKLVAFEIWYDADNKSLVGELQDFLGSDVIDGTAAKGYGVPIIIIGENVYQGFDDQVGEALKNNIDEEYDKKGNERYDVFKAMKKAEDDALKEEKKKNRNIIIWNGIIVAIATIIIIAFINYQNNKIHDRIDAIYNKIGIQIENENNKENILKIQKVADDDEDFDENFESEEDYDLKKEEVKTNSKKKTNSKNKSKSK